MAAYRPGDRVTIQDTERKQAYVYVLYATDDESPKYVGSTVNPATRLHAHIADARKHRRSSSAPKSRWLSSVFARGAEPVMEILEICDYRETHRRELHHIHRFRAVGCSLTNKWMPSSEDRKKPKSPAPAPPQATGGK